MQSLDVLTKQERVILQLVAKGWRNAKIAQELVISTRTVESHLHRIFGKLGVTSRTEAALYTLQSHVFSVAEIHRSADDSRIHVRYSEDMG
jgi:DNA-binding NarL/FixJ family response regulator